MFKKIKYNRTISSIIYQFPVSPTVSTYSSLSRNKVWSGTFFSFASTKAESEWIQQILHIPKSIHIMKYLSSCLNLLVTCFTFLWWTPRISLNNAYLRYKYFMCLLRNTFYKEHFRQFINMNNLILFDFYDLLSIYLSQKNTTRLSHFIPQNEKKHLIKHYAKSFFGTF